MQIYVIERPDGLVKIGRSKEPTKRLRGISTQGGFEISRAWISLPGMFESKTEHLVHQDLANSRSVGEWFDVDFDAAVECVTKDRSETMEPSIKNADSDNPKIQFGRRLSAAFDLIGLSALNYGRLNEAGKLLNVSSRAVGFWLAGSKLPQIDKLWEIAELTGASINWLQSGKGQMLTKDEEDDKTIFELIKPLSKEQRQRAISVLTALVKTYQ